MHQFGEQVSIPHKLLVYSVMANVCSEFSATDSGELAGYNYSLSKTFRKLMLETLGAFSMSTPASLEAAEALMVAVSWTCPAR